MSKRCKSQPEEGPMSQIWDNLNTKKNDDIIMYNVFHKIKKHKSITTQRAHRERSFNY